jgi:hypothetical protein
MKESLDDKIGEIRFLLYVIMGELAIVAMCLIVK